MITTHLSPNQDLSADTRTTYWRIQGGEGKRRTSPSWSNFFHFYGVFFGKKWPNNSFFTRIFAHLCYLMYNVISIPKQDVPNPDIFVHMSNANQIYIYCKNFVYSHNLQASTGQFFVRFHWAISETLIGKSRITPGKKSSIVNILMNFEHI